jgi:siroheme synthase (precorrin-2 oxidase/ferrochelatase)
LKLKKEGNQLFPVFLKLNQLKVLLVGGGNIGLEKLQAVLLNSPEAKITIVSDTFLPALLDFVAAYPEVKLFHRKFISNDLFGHDLVILGNRG